MDRKWISIVFAALLAALGLAVGANQWRKFKRSRLTDASRSAVTPARQLESRSPAGVIQAPATTVPPDSGRASKSQATGANVTPPTSDASRPTAETKSAAEKPDWKTYSSAEYGFEIQYPSGWIFSADFEDNKGKQPSGKRPSGYAGETRTLFSLEMDGPGQSEEGGGDFQDGAVVTVRITGTKAVFESWTIKPGNQWILITWTLEKWLEVQSTPWAGNHIEKAAIGTNGFTGIVEVAHDDSKPEKIWGEAGGAYRLLPSGRALLVEWNRMNVENDLSYQNDLQPMLWSFKLLPQNAKN